MDQIYYFNGCDDRATLSFGQALSSLFSKHLSAARPLIFLCIGSDRATGDSLGPLIGHRLLQYRSNRYLVYGTLENPVHAKNLAETIDEIYLRHKHPFIVAIDASLGKESHIGYYTLGTGSLKPGAGVGKELRSVGEAFITGIVNLSGVQDRMLLQTTRLHIVVSLADRICLGIRYGLRLLDTAQSDESAASCIL